MNCSWWWWVQIQVGSNVIQLIFKRQGPNWLVMLRFCMNNDQAEIFLPQKKRNPCFDCKHVWVGSNNGLRDAKPNYANTMPFGLPFLEYFRVCENHQILIEFDRHHCRSAVYFVGTQKSERDFSLELEQNFLLPMKNPFDFQRKTFSERKPFLVATRVVPIMSKVRFFFSHFFWITRRGLKKRRGYQDTDAKDKVQGGSKTF